MSHRVLIALLASLFVLFFGTDVLAWGPTTHIRIAHEILGNLALLPAAAAALLAKNAGAYLYGNIAADVVFAKRWSRVRQFCHHWTTGFGLLDAAQSEPQQAFAMGYLSHLAADTVAHGKFVPRQIADYRCTMNFGHLYWELRADSVADSEARQSLTKVLDDEWDAHHQFLSVHLQHARLPFIANRILFERMTAVAVSDRFQGVMRLWGECSRWPLPGEILNRDVADSVDRAMAVLSQGRRSALLREDPNGASALMKLAAHRRQRR